MAMTIMNDASAAMTLGELNKNISQLGKQLKKVSSGMKINSAGDDASGYSISEKMRVRIRALDQNERNVQNGAALLRTAEGAIQQQIEIMKTIKEKVIDADNDTNTDLDRATIQKEIDQGYRQIQDIAWETNYNGKLLLVGDTEIDEIYTWKVLDEPVAVPESELNVIPDDYATLNGQTGPFAVFSPFAEKSAKAAPLLGSDSSVSLSNGVDAVPKEATRATFTMDLSGYSSGAALDNVGFTVKGRGGSASTQYYVLTTDTARDYKKGSNTIREIKINATDTPAQVATKIASSIYTGYSYGIANATADGSKVKFTTYGTGESMNTTDSDEKLVKGWSVETSQGTITTGAQAATPGRPSATKTNLFPSSVPITGTDQGYKDVYNSNTDQYDHVKDPDKPPTPATVTKNISSVADGSGIAVTGSYYYYGNYSYTAYIKFVDGNSGLTRQSDGTYTVGKNATVNNVSLTSWENWANGSGNSLRVNFSLSGGNMTLTTTGTGTSSKIAVTDGFSAVAPTAGSSGTQVPVTYSAVSEYSGTVSNAEGGQNKGTPVNAYHEIDLSAYDDSSDGTLNDFIGSLVGKTMSLRYRTNSPYAKYEFIDTKNGESMNAISQSAGSLQVDLNVMRNYVKNGDTVADAFIKLMKNQHATRFTSEAGSKVLKVNAWPDYEGKAGNNVSINISEGKLSQYTIDFKQFFDNNNNVNIPDDLDGKGFRVYCATCPDQWFNFQFTLGGEEDATRPASGSSGADLKTTTINISQATDVSSLVKEIYEKGKDDMNHTLRMAADTDKGTLTIYDVRMFDVLQRESTYPNLQKPYGAKLADGVMDDVIKVKRGIYVKDLVIQHTDHASQNIHVKVPQTTLDHLFNYIEGTRSISEFNVLSSESREMLLGNMKGKKRDGTIIDEDERGALDTALDYLTGANTLIGAQIMRLGMAENNIVTSRESTVFSESTIRDADMAKEMTEYTKANVLAQSAQSMLAQANQNNSAVLGLLQ